MRIFRTGSIDVVKQCQSNFGFLPVDCQIRIRTARFLQKFTASDNSLCLLFSGVASVQLAEIFSFFDDDISTACQLNNFLYDLLYINFI
jgi:hypothetical protein